MKLRKVKYQKWCLICSILRYGFCEPRDGLVTVSSTCFCFKMGASINKKITQIMQNREEKLLNHLYAQWTEIYHLKGVCLEILKDLEQKENLNEKEQYWQRELLTVLFESETI